MTERAKIEDLLKGIQKNVLLASQTTFKIGGPAKYFLTVETKEDLIKAIKVAKEFNPAPFSKSVRDTISNKKQNGGGVNLPFFILGGGSKLLVSDKGYEGLIIKIQMSRLCFLSYGGQAKSECQTKSPFSVAELLQRTGKIPASAKAMVFGSTKSAGKPASAKATADRQNPKIYAEAGASLSQLVNIALKNSLSGFEWAAGIPSATIGGAIRGNAGAFGSSTADVIKNVTALDIKDQEPALKVFNNNDCQFSYRNSIFKQNPYLIILSAEIELEIADKKQIQKKMQTCFEYRKKNHPMNFPSAGSIFMNPCSEIKDEGLKMKYPEIEKFNEEGLIPAGWLIHKSGLAGKKIGGAQISEKHANFIVNLGKAKAGDVAQLIELAKKQVKKKFGIELKEEIQYLGFQFGALGD